MTIIFYLPLLQDGVCCFPKNLLHEGTKKFYGNMRKMHERSIYKVPPDFAKLAEKYESFRKYVNISEDGRGHLNFKNPEAVRELTYTLLKHDFGLCLDIPLNRLIPTVPLRLNYILWIEDLLKESCQQSDIVQGIDIGCGASCIYPLLGAKLNNWGFLTSESDELSFEFARKNVEMNDLSSKITVKKGTSDSLLEGLIEDGRQYSFCMCNPPFFSDREEAAGLNCRSEKRPLPKSVCTATDDEAITEGGEVAFVKKIIKESIELRHTIRWYTSMLGKKTSLKALKQFLNDSKVPFVTHTVFQQGKTTRWGICWSFCQKGVQRPKSPTSKFNPLPFRFVVPKSEMEQRYTKERHNLLNELAKVKLVSNDLQSLLTGLEASFTESSEFNDAGDVDHVIIGEAWKNTWSHQRQKRRLEKRLKIAEQETCDKEHIEQKTSSSTDDRSTNGKKCHSPIDAVCEGERVLIGEYTPCKEEHEPNLVVGNKRSHVSTGEENTNSGQAPILKFKIVTSSNRDSDIVDSEPVKVDVFCLEGKREYLHQLYMYLRNELKGIQKHQKRK